MKKRLIFFNYIILLSGYLLIENPSYGQQAGIASVSMDTVNTVPGTLVLMPVVFDGWDQPGVNAISIDMHIPDTSVIGFRGLQNFCPAIPSFGAGQTNYVSATQHIYISWSSLTASTIASDTLLNIVLFYKGGTSAIEFNDMAGQCEIADFDGISYATTWNNGLVSTSTSIQSPKVTSEQVLTVFPNPADDLCFLSFQKSQNSQISVHLYDQMGESVLYRKSAPRSTTANEISLNVRSLPEGFYYYIAETISNGNMTKMAGKIIVKH